MKTWNSIEEKRPFPGDKVISQTSAGEIECVYREESGSYYVEYFDQGGFCLEYIKYWKYRDDKL